jgi:hypothetical protein
VGGSYDSLICGDLGKSLDSYTQAKLDKSMVRQVMENPVKIWVGGV